MESVFGWLGDIFSAILKFVPRLVIVRQTHKMVRFRWGSKVIVSNPGLRMYWPLTTEIEVTPIVRQTTNLETQYLTTKDGRCLGVAGILIFEVEDVKKLFTKTWDYEDTIRDFAYAAIKKVVCTKTLNELLEDSVSIDKELTESLAEDLGYYGIDTIKCTLTDLAAWPAFMIDNLLHRPAHEHEETQDILH